MPEARWKYQNFNITFHRNISSFKQRTPAREHRHVKRKNNKNLSGDLRKVLVDGRKEDREGGYGEAQKENVNNKSANQ